MFKDSRVLITGGTGSWGNELVSQLLERDPGEIIIFSRGEFSQVTMQRKFSSPKLKFVIGDIRDYDAVEFACRGVDYIIHLAALKHVPICEEQPVEAIKTNINGTRNLIRAAIDHKVKKVIDVSTDKAVHPMNLYGMTKAVGERLTIQANQLTNSTHFTCIRGGNVLGSNGSVVPYFIQQIRTNNIMTITDMRMTRYFLTLRKAISLLFRGMEDCTGGETFVMKMPSCYISKIAEILAQVYGNKDTTMTEIGMKPGEKLDEVLISTDEARQTYVLDDTYFLIRPTLKIEGIEEHYGKMNLKKADFAEYTSRTYMMSDEQVREMLKEGGFI